MAKTEDKKTMSFRLPERLHRALRMRAGREGRKIEVVAAEALEHYLPQELAVLAQKR